VFISSAFAQAPAGSTGETGLIGFLPIILMFVLLYFLMIRPQMKRQKEQKAMIDALQKGDEVVVAGGIAGRITKLGDPYVRVEIAPEIEISVQKAAVQMLLPKNTLKSLQ
jgi:preprotein translocase subunit YajC